VIKRFRTSRGRDRVASHAYWRNTAERFLETERSTSWTKGAIRWYLRRRLAAVSQLLCLEPGHLVVDLGCGSGDLLELAGRADVMIVGVDISEFMLRHVSQKLNVANARGRLFLRADACRLPLRDSQAHVVLSTGLVDYLENPDAFFAEAGRILRPAGRLIVTVPKRPSPFTLIRRGLGARFRERVFDLPPIPTDMSRRDVVQTLASHGFALRSMRSLAQASWLIEAERLPPSDG
jgi:ubiquinone/menaquinone biosynthesis C-methylase UbiE